MTHPHEPLPAATETLYRAFARYALKPRIAGCPHCVAASHESALHTAPLRALSAGDLERFAAKAMSTFGDADDYQHFLPRILELALTRPPFLGLEPWLIGRKLAYGVWRTWPLDTQAAVESWVAAAMEASLASGLRAADAAAPAWQPSDSLELACAAGIAPEPLLARLWPAQGDAALRAIAALARSFLTPPGSDDRTEGALRVVAWLRTPERFHALEARAREHPDPDVASELNDAATLMRAPVVRASTAAAPVERVAPTPTAPPASTGPAASARAEPAVIARLIAEHVPSGQPLGPFDLRPGGELRIGRTPACELYLPDLVAGRTNSVVKVDPHGRITIMHTGHPCSIAHNGAPLTGLCELRPGDVVEHYDNQNALILRLRCEPAEAR